MSANIINNDTNNAGPNKPLLNKLYDLIKTSNDFINNDGKILRNVVKDAADNENNELINLLAADEQLKETFFNKVSENIYVFEKEKFKKVIDSYEFMPNSYTKFCERIGLTDRTGAFLSDSNDVVLQFPHKDCYLEGGQTKEDQKYFEVFYNEVLARDEIDRLLSPKVFKNVIKYSKEGAGDLFPLKEEQPTTFDIEKDNLLIKGNNLVALSSILKSYEGKVQTIFIDPPYNTGKDEFNYNDKFNQSTWLIFMTNRLKTAKKLLTKNGSIFISIDTNQSHYLKVLLDSIFGKKHFRNEIIWNYNSGGIPETFFAEKHDTIFWYSNSEENWIFNKDSIGEIRGHEKKNNMKKNIDEDGRVYFSIKSNGKIYKYYEDDLVTPTDVWTGINHLQQKDPERLGFNTQKPERLLQRIILCSTNKNDVVLDYHVGTGTTCAVAHKLERRYIGIEQMDYINDFARPRLINVLNGDTSGISKDKDVNGQGQGSFIYCELAEDENAQYLKKIENATEENINSIRDEIFNNAIIRYEVDDKDKALKSDDWSFTYSENKKEKEYKLETLEQKKEALKQLIDKNYMYINYSEIDDSKYANDISETDKAFTKSFYEGV